MILYRVRYILITTMRASLIRPQKILDLHASYFKNQQEFSFPFNDGDCDGDGKDRRMWPCIVRNDNDATT